MPDSTIPALIIFVGEKSVVCPFSPDAACSLGRQFVFDDFGILDQTVSRDHCQIRWKGRNFWIKDGTPSGTNSLRGTLLNGQRLPFGQWVPIPPTALVQIGETVLRLDYQNPSSTEFDLMISYSRKDEAPVLEIYRRMQNLGIRPWMDQKSQGAAEQYKEAIEQAILTLKTVAIFWGGDRMGDVHAAEVKIVTDLHIRNRITKLFLIVLPGSESPNWGLFLDGIDWYDLRKGSGEMERLMKDLTHTVLPEQDR